MVILVIGRGWVGTKMANCLLSRGHAVIFLSHEVVENKYFYAKLPFDWVVNCAGITGTPNVDACEFNIHQTYLANAIFPVLLYKFSQTLGAKFAHFSSGCIYEGNINRVEAEPNFFGSVYSISKGVSDVYLRDKAVIFRIRMPFTNKEEPKNLLSKLIYYSKYAKLIEGGANSITDLDEAIEKACDILEQNKSTGIFNLVNAGHITIEEIADMLDLRPVWYTPEEFKEVTVAKRSNCIIPSIAPMSPVKDALLKRIEEYNQNIQNQRK